MWKAQTYSEVILSFSQFFRNIEKCTECPFKFFSNRRNEGWSSFVTFSLKMQGFCQELHTSNCSKVNFNSVL